MKIVAALEDTFKKDFQGIFYFTQPSNQQLQVSWVKSALS